MLVIGDAVACIKVAGYAEWLGPALCSSVASSVSTLRLPQCPAKLLSASSSWQDAVGERKGLAAKVVAVSGQQMVGAWLPELLEPIAATLCSDEYASSLAEELPYHTYASPFLQAYLVAQRGHRYSLPSRIDDVAQPAPSLTQIATLPVFECRDLDTCMSCEAPPGWFAVST